MEMSSPRQKVLIVDDDPDDRMIILETLKNCDASVECYELQHGNGVLDYMNATFTDTLPSFILLDLNMPGKNGKQVLKELKSDSKYIGIPIIIFTTTSSAKERQESYFLGANCFVTKPHNYNSFRGILGAITNLYCHNTLNGGNKTNL
jgi:two-component system response regulator